MGFDGTKKLKKNSSNGRSDEAQAISDGRFASAQSDPRFMEAPKRRSKVEIDSRFSRAFTDARFGPSNAPVDKRGKQRKNKGDACAASLSHYYSLQPQEENQEPAQIDEENEDGDDNLISETESESEKLDMSPKEDEDDEHDFDESSSTSATDSESDDFYMNHEDEDSFMPQEEIVPEIDKETRRLAVVNLDWSQVRAVDLYVLLSSFLPKGGQILSVAVYPSDFGITRMEEEEIRGPVGLFDNEEDEHDESEDDEMDNRKLRAYELSRLRYYYAVVECDSSATTDYIYKCCDGVEFERSANKLDLRFIPDSMKFKHPPRDVATEAPADYEGTDFQTSALQHSNIRLTWDEDEPRRTKILKRKLNEKQLEELELNEFLASDESGSECEDNSNDVEDESVKKRRKRDKYHALLQPGGDGSDVDCDDQDGAQDMEVTFNSGLEDLSKRILEKKDKKSETVWEAVLRKRREKKKKSRKGSNYSSDDDGDDSDDSDGRELSEQPDDFFVNEPFDTGNGEERERERPMRRKRKADEEKRREAEASQAELELLAVDDIREETNLKGYSLKPKKIKGKKGKVVVDDGKIPDSDYDDPRFASFFRSPHFALDPTDPQFKRSASYARQITEKQKMSINDNADGQSELPGQVSDITSHGLSRKKEKNELSSLVRSIKMKSNRVPPPLRHNVLQKCKNLSSKEKMKR